MKTDDLKRVFEDLLNVIKIAKNNISKSIEEKENLYPNSEKKLKWDDDIKRWYNPDSENENYRDWVE